MPDSVIEIQDRPERGAYVLLVDGERAGYVTYRLDGERLTVDHTKVTDAFSGRGFGGRLARHVLDDARRRDLRVIPRCPFLAGYIRTHPEYQDLVDAA